MNRPARIIAFTAVILVVSTAALLVAMRGAPSGGAATGTNSSLTTARVQRTDLTATQQVTGALGYADGVHVTDRLPGTYTALPDEGTVVAAGQSLYSVDNEPVMLLAGVVPVWRAFAPGMADGVDVAQLQRALSNLPGAVAVGLRPDGHYGAATVGAVNRWQRSLGLATTGTVEFGRVMFSPTALRVGARGATIGDSAQPGQMPYATTSTTRVVTIDLDVTRQASVQVGQPVTVELPSGIHTPASITAIGRVAQQPSGQSNNARPFIAVTAKLANPAAAGSLDQQPVAVDLTTATRHGVLAVPITALLALREGGFGVETINPTGRHQIVAVTPGLFTQTLVEVDSSGIRPGTTVVTAQ